VLIALLKFLTCAGVIIIAGTFLARCADAIADLTGLGRLLIGSILLAAGTSLPELSFGVNAVRQGYPNIAVGDLMGAGLFNLLILAVIDCLHYSKGKMLSRAAAAHALSATVSMALTALAGASILLGQHSAEWVVWGVDPSSLAILGMYLLGVRLIFFDQRVSAAEHAVQEIASGAVAPGTTTTWTIRGAIAGFVAAAAAILVVGPYMADAAGELAELSGLGGTFVGTTLVAISTTLPELVAMLSAVRIGAFDLAVGNVFGSIAFNMVLIVPLDIAYRNGSLMGAVSTNHALTCLATVVVSCVAVAGQLYKVERRKKFLEPDAVMMLVLICGVIWLLYVIR
jgi:cation:H+ antiporter